MLIWFCHVLLNHREKLRPQGCQKMNIHPSHLLCNEINSQGNFAVIKVYENRPDVKYRIGSVDQEPDLRRIESKVSELRHKTQDGQVKAEK